MLCPGSPMLAPASLVVVVSSSTAETCATRLARLSDEVPIRTWMPAWSRPETFQKKVARSRSRHPSRCSSSVPARGGSHGGGVQVNRSGLDSVQLMSHTVKRVLADPIETQSTAVRRQTSSHGVGSRSSACMLAPESRTYGAMR